MTSLTSLRITGAALILLALLHIAFPNRFEWRKELARLSQLNREMFLVHTFFVTLILVLMGVLLLLEPGVLLKRTRLGLWVTGGFTIFWGFRAAIQWFGYSRSLWWRKPFETCVHVIFSLGWIWLTWLGFALWRLQLN